MKPEGRDCLLAPGDLFSDEYREANKVPGKCFTLPELAERDAAIRREALEEIEKLQAEITDREAQYQSTVAFHANLRVENARLREIIVSSIFAIGGSASKESSVEFLEGLPNEIRLVTDKLKARQLGKYQVAVDVPKPAYAFDGVCVENCPLLKFNGCQFQEKCKPGPGCPRYEGDFQ